ncbi:alpha/beta hydrolase [Fictibacillus phosphorivorans]|uniref:alpha/beta hydrolase n=1 Tax=Fictibacillus phosphorivorans TaxID=1221500 RepID=UPI0018E73966
MAILKGSITDDKIYSNYLDEEIDLLIYLPSKFTPLVKYPILIAQDGRDYFQLGKLAKTADLLMEEENLQSCIIVGVNHKGIEDRKAKYDPTGEKHENYIRFMAFELTSYLNEKFNTLQLGAGMGLIGDSLGGYIAFKLSILYPNTFGKVIVQSPYVPESLIETVESIEHMQTLTIYHSIGDEEEQFTNPEGITKDFLTPNRQLSKLLNNLALDYEYAEFQGNHLWVNWQKDLIPALRFLYSDQ